MPIAGLTDQQERRIPKLGQWRKGAPKTSPKKPGQDLTYFRLVTEIPDIEAWFAENYDEEPRTFHVRLPYPTIRENFPNWHEEWVAGGLKHRCDSKTMILWQDDSGFFREEPKPCPYAALPKGHPDRKCSPSGILYVVFHELLDLGYWGYFEVITGSIWDCLELDGNLRDIEDTAMQVGMITGKPITLQHIPCVLTREPRKISTPRPGGQRARAEKWLLHLKVNPEYLAMLAKAQKQYALPVFTPRAEIEAPEHSLDFDPGNENGIVDGEAEEVPEAETEEPAGNGLVPHTPRPLKPHTLRQYLRRRVGDDNGTQATEKQIPFVARKFAECFAPDDDAEQKYHTCLLWLWGVDSAKKLTKEEANVTLNWLLAKGGPDETGDTPLHEYAPEEARLVHRQALKDKGQADMFEDELPF